eukprot:Phypoly_transcript_08410.p1 GENE.Phypoly_transcript_08410~~Phypoly_transcript_08410.p1  ORF type:complete len:459 (+),score=55.10 Phypoly_transcript_08410:108-1484(+)
MLDPGGIELDKSHGDTSKERQGLISVEEDGIVIKRQRKWLVIAQGFGTLMLSFAEQSALSITSIEMSKEKDWNDDQQGALLSATFFGGMIVQLLAGFIINTIGIRPVLSSAFFLCALLNFAVPFFVDVSFILVVANRAVAGALLSTTFPSSMGLVANWIPEESRSSTYGIVSSGGTVGAAGGQFVTGFVVKYINWKYVFFAIGVAEALWGLFLFLSVRDKPTHTSRKNTEEHVPLLSRAKESLKTIRYLLLIPGMSATMAAVFAGDWANNMLVSWLPKFLSDAHPDMDTSVIGSAVALPTFAATISCMGAGFVSDWMLHSHAGGRFPIQFTSPIRVARVFFNTIGQFGYGLALFAVPHVIQSGKIVPIVFVGITIWTMCGIAGAGQGTSNLDISPQHTSLVYGFSSTISQGASWVSVYLTGIILQETGSYRTALFIASGWLFLGGTIFAIWGNKGIKS